MNKIVEKKDNQKKTIRFIEKQGDQKNVVVYSRHNQVFDLTNFGITKNSLSLRQKNAIIYSIYSPSLDLTYYGSTQNPLSLRKAIHLYNWKKVKEGTKEDNLTAYKVLKGEDCIFKQEQNIGAGVTKSYLLEKEKEYIRKMKLKLKDKVVNKNDGICTDIKLYQKKYRDNHKEYFINYRQVNKAKLQKYRDDRKDKTNKQKKEQYEKEQRARMIKKLNEGSYKKTPIKKLEKYNIGYNSTLKIYY